MRLLASSHADRHPKCMEWGMWVRLALSSGRFKEIGSVLARYGLADWIHRLDGQGLIRRTYRWVVDDQLSDLSQGERWCRALTELGPVFIKLG